ncbi:hypothetical protein KSS87_013152, partial [Heliosperma pusillum]
MKKKTWKMKRKKKQKKNEVNLCCGCGGEFIEGQIHLNARENDPRTKCTESKFPITILNCPN